MGAGIGEMIAGITQSVNDTIGLGYGIYQDQRDFWENKAQIDETRRREDNALQRRVVDAKLAGLNPYDVAGTGSGAGMSSSFSSKSVQSGLNIGSFYDFALAKERLKQEKEKTLQEKYNTQLSKFAVGSSARSDFYGRLGFQYDTGAGMSYYSAPSDPVGYYHPMFSYDKPDNISDFDYFKSHPYLDQMSMGYNNFIRQSDMLKKENDWYTTNQILNAINSGTGSVGNLTGSFGHIGSGVRDFSMGYKFRNNEPIIKPQIGFRE